MRSLCIALSAVLLVAAPGFAQEGRRVIVERFAYRLTGIGAKVTATAGVLDDQARVEPNAPISWRVENSSVATVSSRGLLTARALGSTRLWAVSGLDSASASVVVSQSANTIDFIPAFLRFDAVGARMTARISVRDSAGALLAELSRTNGACRSLDDRVATFGGNGQVLARGIGMTYLHCRSREAIDSARVEVGQWPTQVDIADAPSGPMSVGDTVRVRARVKSNSGAQIANASATWASFNPAVVEINRVTGWARAIAPGVTSILAQVGEIFDTVRVRVQAPSSEFVLRLEPILPVVGDTVVIEATISDASGAPVAAPNHTLALRSTRPYVVLVIGGQRIVALNTGTAWLVATSGNLSDSILVAPRARSSIAVASQAIAVSAAEQHPRPPRDSTRAADLPSRSTPRMREKFASLTATASRTAHKSRLAQGINESRSGLLLGGAASVAPSKTLVFTGDFRVGTLGGDNSGGGDLRITEIDGQLIYSHRPWLSLRSGFARRSESTNLVLHHWQFASVTAMTRFAFAGGAINTFSAVSLIPWARFSGHLDNAGKPVSPNKTSFAVEMGAELQTAILSAGITYSSEKFTFPAVNGVSRQDQFSSLRLRIGVQTGLWR